MDAGISCACFGNNIWGFKFWNTFLCLLTCLLILKIYNTWITRASYVFRHICSIGVKKKQQRKWVIITVLTYLAETNRTTNSSFASWGCYCTSLSSWCSHCLGLSSVARYAIRSKAVSRVWRRDDTKIKTGFAGEWLRMAANRGSKTSWGLSMI